MKLYRKKSPLISMLYSMQKLNKILICLFKKFKAKYPEFV